MSEEIIDKAEELGEREAELTEYTTFLTTNKDNEEIEMAVIDEFEFENKNYVAAALVEGDTVNTDGLYIFKVKAFVYKRNV